VNQEFFAEAARLGIFFKKATAFLILFITGPHRPKDSRLSG
jgi:hypothetical protein